MSRWILILAVAGSIVGGLACVGSSQVPDDDSYAAESPAQAEQQEEEDATTRDAER